MPVAMLTRASRESVPPTRKRHRAAELYLDHSRPRVPPTNATAGAVSLEVLEQGGEENLNGKILIDISNPLDFSKGMPPTLWVSNTDSLGEQIQRRFPEARVVKTLHTMNAYLMVDPTQLAGCRPHRVRERRRRGGQINCDRAAPELRLVRHHRPGRHHHRAGYRDAAACLVEAVRCIPEAHLQLQDRPLISDQRNLGLSCSRSVCVRMTEYLFFIMDTNIPTLSLSNQISCHGIIAHASHRQRSVTRVSEIGTTSTPGNSALAGAPYP